MNSDSARRVFAVFDAAVELAVAERAAFLDAACGTDAGLRAEVEAMLAADAAAHPLLDHPPASLLDALPEARLPAVARQRVGPYRIVRELGRGGMGVVYLAVRDDVGKRVALKLVRGALAAPETLQRFFVERRILARLEHPHIAALLDAGVTEDGTPWFAMERIEGEPITAAADRHRLGIAERLRLFEQVCEAVAHAHRHRIVHRDLKPSNILLDGARQVKLLDFGIAKLLDEEADGDGLTRTGLRPMTPEYAAPEQVRGEAITPATDVYALGAVLYELLTGHRPQRVRDASLAEVERAVLHTEPPPPSIVVGRTEAVVGSAGEHERITPVAVAAARATEPRWLRRRLAGDLDAIVLRAMAKAPERRYASAAELLADLRAHSRGLPIAAHPYTRRYRARRFLARHPGWSRVAAGAAALAIGIAALDVAGFRGGRADEAGAAPRFVQPAPGSFDRRESGPNPPATTLVVFPFAFRGSPEWEFLGEGMVKLVGTRLEGTSGEFRVVDTRTVHNLVSHVGGDPRDARWSRAAAERLGVEAYVLGEIVEAGGRLRITATLHDLGRGGEVGEQTTVEGEGSAVFSLIDELSARLLARSGRSGSLGSVAAHTTDSARALLAFLEGERELRRSRYGPASEAFRRAVAADSTFALAYYGMSRAANWQGNIAAEAAAAALALRYADRLTLPDRLLIRAWSHYREGEVAVADSLYRAVLRARPNDVEAWMHLGEIGFHFGAMLGRPAAESRGAFEHVLAHEPRNVGALVHLARLVAQQGELERLDSLARQVVALDRQGEAAFQLSVLRSLAHGEPELPVPLQERLLFVEAPALRELVVAAAAHGRHPERALWLARHAAERLDLLGGGAWAQVMAAQLELARGRWSAARAELEALGRRAPELAGEFRAAFLTLPLLEVPPADLDSARVALARAAIVSHPITTQSVEQRYTFLLGALSVRLGDTAAVRRYVDALQRYEQADTPGDSAFSRRFALDLRAQLAGRLDRPAEALALLGPPASQPDRRRAALTSYYKASERWLRAESLHALGRDAEALRLYASFPDPDAYDLIYWAPSHLRRAQLHERRGEHSRATHHYTRFVELWRDADPALQPLVRQARARLERLGAP